MLIRISAIAFCLLTLRSVQAQIVPEESVPEPQTPVDQGGAVGGGGGSSFEEPEIGQMRAFADIVRSRGMATLQDSEALKNVEQARATNIESRLRATQNYYDIKRMNEEYRASKRAEPLTFEGYVRLARAQAPDRLSVSELDPYSGLIKWPAVLREPAYALQCDEIQDLYSERANEVASNKLEIQKACEQLLQDLKRDIASFSQTDYLQASKFVGGLKYEAVVARN